MLSHAPALMLVESREATAVDVHDVGPAGRPGHEADDGFAPEGGVGGGLHVDQRSVELTKQDGYAYPGFQSSEDFDQAVTGPMRGHVDAVVAFEQSTLHVAGYDGPHAAHAGEVRPNHQHTATGGEQKNRIYFIQLAFSWREQVPLAHINSTRLLCKEPSFASG